MARPGRDEFLTPAEVAARLKVSRATVYALIDRGTLAATRVGMSIRVVERDLLDFMRRPSAPRGQGAVFKAFSEPAGSCIAVRGPVERRPVIFTEPYVMVAQVHDQNGGALDEYALWQGTPPAARTSSSRDVWADAAFFRWTSSGGTAELRAHFA